MLMGGRKGGGGFRERFAVKVCRWKKGMSISKCVKAYRMAAAKYCLETFAFDHLPRAMRHAIDFNKLTSPQLLH